MQRSLCLSVISAALAASGCGDDTCGPGGAPSRGLTASSTDATLVFGDLTFLAGNDCPDPDAPAGVISLSLEGFQTDGGAGRITLCIPRPDLLMSGARTLGTPTSTADVRIIDLNGTAASCTFAFDSSRAPTGSATATGVCSNGIDPAGFALSIDAAVTLRRTCGAAVDTIDVTLAGEVAIAERPS
jgi:hypothetical protein